MNFQVGMKEIIKDSFFYKIRIIYFVYVRNKIRLGIHITGRTRILFAYVYNNIRLG